MCYDLKEKNNNGSEPNGARNYTPQKKNDEPRILAKCSAQETRHKMTTLKQLLNLILIVLILAILNLTFFYFGLQDLNSKIWLGLIPLIFANISVLLRSV